MTNTLDDTMCNSAAPDDGCRTKFPNKIDPGPCALCARKLAVVNDPIELRKLNDVSTSTVIQCISTLTSCILSINNATSVVQLEDSSETIPVAYVEKVSQLCVLFSCLL